MADLDPAHIEAVADLVAHIRDQYPRLPTDADSHEIAETLLTSTDPAVHAALLAALVRAGVLRSEVDAICNDRERMVTHKERRYVTEWEAL